MIPSVAGIWDRGVSMLSGAAAKDNLIEAVRVAESLGSNVILVAFFKNNTPDMKEESSYGGVVETLQKAASDAANAGVTFGLENSLSPAENKQLVDWVGHPNVKVYYDPYNMAHYGYADEAVPGVALLGKDRICQVHVKNGGQLVSQPGLVDWAALFQAFNTIGYEGWYVFETAHKNRSEMIADTQKNILFMREHCEMPPG